MRWDVVKLIPVDKRKLLLSDKTSVANKLHIIADLKSQGYYCDVDFKTCIERIKLRFNPMNNWELARDYLNDVMSKYEKCRIDGI